MVKNYIANIIGTGNFFINLKMFVQHFNVAMRRAKAVSHCAGPSLDGEKKATYQFKTTRNCQLEELKLWILILFFSPAYSLFWTTLAQMQPFPKCFHLLSDALSGA